MGTPIVTRENNFYDFLAVSPDVIGFHIGSTLKEKNLLIEEQIYSFKS